MSKNKPIPKKYITVLVTVVEYDENHNRIAETTGSCETCNPANQKDLISAAATAISYCGNIQYRYPKNENSF
jgi:hypothetical protein